jgi:hypothetical protein
MLKDAGATLARSVSAFFGIDVRTCDSCPGANRVRIIRIIVIALCGPTRSGFSSQTGSPYGAKEPGFLLHFAAGCGLN